MSEYEMRERLSKLEAVVGPNSDDGLRGDIGEIKATMATIVDRISASERRFAMMIGGGLVIIWIIERFVK
jgi:hypothetical protein